MIIPLVILAIGLFVWFFQWLWNILLPDILGVKSINYWQAFGVLILSKILFGGMRFHKKNGHFKQKLEQINIRDTKPWKLTESRWVMVLGACGWLCLGEFMIITGRDTTYTQIA